MLESNLITSNRLSKQIQMFKHPSPTTQKHRNRLSYKSTMFPSSSHKSLKSTHSISFPFPTTLIFTSTKFKIAIWIKSHPTNLVRTWKNLISINMVIFTLKVGMLLKMVVTNYRGVEVWVQVTRCALCGI